MKNFRKHIIATIAVLKNFRRRVIIAVIALILGLAYTVNSFYTHLKGDNTLMVQPLLPPDNFATRSEATNVVPKAVPLTVVRATPESLASIAAKAGKPASPGEDNSPLLFTSAEVPRTPVAETPLTPTPIPPAAILLGSGLVALFVASKRIRDSLT